MRFAKWQGLGNDYILVQEHEIPSQDANGQRALELDAVNAICDRHFGIGGDGILVLGTSDGGADATMLIHNPDGSRAEMCGNGIRMAARFLLNEGVVSSTEMSVLTEGGIVRPIVLDDARVRVDMGIVHTTEQEELRLDGGARYEGRDVNVGNPHFVIRQDPEGIELAQLGPQIEHHERFPDRTNVEFYRVDDSTHVTMRVWERGVGETLACGTGACAVGVSAILDSDCSSPLVVSLPGGDLEIEMDAERRVFMTGPASEIYRGEIDLTELVRSWKAYRSATQTLPKQPSRQPREEALT